MPVKVRDDRIVRETRGNPLALVELTRGLTPAELASGFGLPDTRPLANRVERAFLQRAHGLPAMTQRLLLVAAAEPEGDAGLLWRAAERLGITSEAGRPAETAGLIELGTQVRFTHPLVRSAVYRGAAPGDRREVHRALAEATDPVSAPDRRAWHTAHATAAPDEQVAAAMVAAAERAQRRGDRAAAAAFLQRAIELTPDLHMRVERSLATAQAKLDLADHEAAFDLIAAAQHAPLDELQRARLERLRGRIAFARRRGSDALPLLLDAARRLEAVDAPAARETYIEAIASAMFVGRLGVGADVSEVARIAGSASLAPGAHDRLLAALAARYSAGYAAGLPALSEAIHAVADDSPWLGLACRLAQDLWNDELWHALATRGVDVARESGALSTLPISANYLAAFHIHAGAFGTARALIDEVDAITQATGLAPLKYAALMLTAWQGDQVRAHALFSSALEDATLRGEGTGLGTCGWGIALLHNGGGRHEEAFAAARRACEHEDVIMFGWALVELIEAAVRTGKPAAAHAALERLSERTRASGTEWALGVEAGSRALLSDDGAAEALHRESVERLGRSRGAIHLARAQLRFGEWLRRQSRRTEARALLRDAHAAFTRNGALAFAERASRELLATGETARRHTDHARDVLTPQEAEVARLARDGRTNPEIGAQLYLSPRTVEYHLHKVFRKLDVTTRKELRRALPEGGALTPS